MIAFDSIRIEFEDRHGGGPARITGNVESFDHQEMRRAMNGEDVIPGVRITSVRENVQMDARAFGAQHPLGPVGPAQFKAEAAFYGSGYGRNSWIVTDRSGQRFRLSLEALPPESISSDQRHSVFAK